MRFVFRQTDLPPRFHQDSFLPR